MSPEDFARAMWTHRVSAIIRTDRRDVAAAAMEAAVRGGIRIVEFTLTTPGALDLVAEFSARRDLPEVDGLDRLIVGAGTVLRPQDVRDVAAAGGRFVVSPVLDPEVIREAQKRGIASMPGGHTPTELLTAHRLGATLLKLFPAPAGGPAWLVSVLAPMPFLRVVPTNGVDLENLAAWLHAGAWGVGLVRPLFAPAAMEAADVSAIEARARALRSAAMSVVRSEATPPHDPFAS